MHSFPRVTIFLCCAWAGSLLYGEMVAYWVPLWSCSWPHLSSSSSSRIDNKSDSDGQVNIAVLADPQLMNRTTLGLASKSLALKAAQFYTDLYMRRSFLSSIQPFKPDLILFLGDQFDGGPFLSDQEWQESLNRFRHIFYQKEKGRNSDVKVYYLSGNHDIGYAALYSRHPEVITRFEKEFGTRNYRFTVQKMDFVAIDAQILDGPTEGNFTSLSLDFIKNISKDLTPHSRVLLTHIPLYRPDGTSCGPHRSSPIVNQRVSRAGSDKRITYQNYLTEETSKHLLESVKPMLVLSGHDHDPDQCSVNHSTSYGTVTEYTLGTVSWQQGNLYPSFMLLSVSAPTFLNATTQGHQISTRLCFLPMQTHIYLWYLSLFVVTLFMLLFWPTSGLRCWDKCTQLFRSFTATSKEKDEDEDCDYEMVWDAEGSMHLVKKATPRIPVTSLNDVRLTGRGNVIARPTARKLAEQEAEASITLDMNADAKSDSRPGKSRTRRVIQRLIRVLRRLLIIAVVNVPLYMMLLFKDWIEL